MSNSLRAASIPTPSCPPVEFILDQRIDRLNAQAQNAQALTCRLMKVADRLLGGVPQCAKNAEAVPAADGSLGQLEHALDWMSDVLQSLGDVVERLERL